MSRLRVSFSVPHALVLLCVLILCGLPAVFMNSIFGYLPLLFSVFALLLSLVYTLLLAGRVRCADMSEPASCVRGERVPMQLAIENTSALVCTCCRAVFYTTDLFGAVRSVQELRFTLSPHEKREFSFQVSFDHVGQYAVGVKKLCVDGLFRVISFEQTTQAVKPVKVLPRLHTLGDLIISETVQNESQHANRISNAESIDCAGVREYAFGDPIKLIHWKLSSHTGNYVTKQLESYGNFGLTILANMNAPAYDAESLMDVYDALLECCAALGCYARNNGIDTELLSYSPSGEKTRLPISDGGNFAQLIELLPQVRTQNHAQPLTELLRTEAVNRYANSNIAICTAELDEEIAHQILQLSLGGKMPLVFYIRPYSQDKSRGSGQKALKTLRSRGISCYMIPCADEIGKVVRV
jgi:uncharacterized protein (DUF58 family)